MQTLLKALETAGVEWECNCPMAEHSSFRIGGAAELALFPRSRTQLLAALRILSEGVLPILVIGNASNVVFSDAGYRGAVIFTKHCRRFFVTQEGISAEAGASLSALSNAAREASLSGLAFAFGIPGTLGGAVFMNAGAYGGCMADVCTASEYFDLETGRAGVLRGAEHAFGERTSLYHTHPSWVILGAELTLQEGTREQIHGDMTAFLERRRASQPLELPNAGSIFKRPVGHFAGKLIEDCGLKGMRVGGAEVSVKHAGFIVNRGGATCEDVKRLIELVRERVLREKGVELECEIRFL